MLIVADTSALLALAAADELRLLDTIFREVRVPPAVWNESTVSGKPEAVRLASYLHGKVLEVDLADFVIATTGLGRGELEAMALYKHLHADRLLLDDARARRVARLNGIEVIGSLGVLLLGKSCGLVAELRPRIEAIRAAGIYLSDGLVGEALEIAGEA